MRRTYIVAILLICSMSLLAVGAAGTAFADEHDTPTQNESADPDNGDLEGATEAEEIDDQDGVDPDQFTLDELRSDGVTAANAPPSTRMHNDRMYWIIHWPASAILGTPGDPMDDSWLYLGEEGGSVDRNTIYLRSINMDQTETVTVTIVYYDVEQQVVEEGNATTTEEQAVNVETKQVRAELQRGWSMAAIPLQKNPDHRYVTMWIEGQEDDLRWTFTHQSVATTQAAGIDTYGDYLTRAGIDFLGPILVGSFLTGVIGRRAIKKAGIGPQWGYTKWLIVLTLGTVAIGFHQFSSLAEVVVAAPRMLALYVVGVFAIVLIETYTTGVSKAAFFKPELTDATSPSGNDAYDMVRAKQVEEQTVRMNDGHLAVVRPGLRAFLSRCFGGAARLENAEQISTKVDLVESPIDEVYFVDPKADRVLDYKPESWQISVPDPDSRAEWFRMGSFALLAVMVAFAVYSFAGNPLYGTLSLLALATLAVVRPEDGYARIDPAPAHMRSAWASMLYLSIEAEDAETIEQARKENIRLQAKSEKEVDAALQDQDATLIQEMFGNDIERSVKKLRDQADKWDSSEFQPALENGEGRDKREATSHE